MFIYGESIHSCVCQRQQSHSSFQSLLELHSLPAHLATPGSGREDESPCMAVESLAKQEESGTLGVIGKMSEAATATEHVSEWTC